MDTVNAGPGDLVLVEQEGNAARQLLGTIDDPFHSVIVGVVDKVYIEKTEED
jgi:ethanolamine utilization protein EutN